MSPYKATIMYRLSLTSSKEEMREIREVFG